MIDPIEKLKKYNQNHIIEMMNLFDDEEKNNIIEQVNRINLDEIDSLYMELSNKEKVLDSNIEEIVAVNKDKITLEEQKEINTLGENIIKNNQYALVTMSGGQGTRLGYDKAKGTFIVNIMPSPKSLFEILADKLKKVKDEFNVITPWYIMTSEENDKQIEDFFVENNYFNYPREYIMFFKQDNLPMLTEDKKLIINKEKNIKEAASGNGSIFNAMYKNGVLTDMKKRGIKWIFISSIDNILLKIADPMLIGLAEKENVEIATKSILRNSPEEKVGAICKKDGKIYVIEYSEMSDEMKTAVNENGEFKFGESHIMCNLFSLNALNELAQKKLPYHIAHKKSEYLNEKGELVIPQEPNAYKFETFIFDSWKYFDKIAILRGKREEDFAPIKNKEGVDSPSTAVDLYNKFYFKEEI